MGGTWIPVIQKETTFPARRFFSFNVELTDEIRIEEVIPPKSDEDKDGEDEIEVNYRTLSNEVLLKSFFFLIFSFTREERMALAACVTIHGL